VHPKDPCQIVLLLFLLLGWWSRPVYLVTWRCVVKPSLGDPCHYSIIKPETMIAVQDDPNHLKASDCRQIRTPSWARVWYHGMIGQATCQRWKISGDNI
jgi:hypothetical protein